VDETDVRISNLLDQQGIKMQYFAFRWEEQQLVMHQVPGSLDKKKGERRCHLFA
jgi:hypothetical protein